MNETKNGGDNDFCSCQMLNHEKVATEAGNKLPEEINCSKSRIFLCK